MRFLAAAFSERNGKPSSHRLTIFLFILDVMTVWTINTLRNPSYVMDATVLLAVVSALGIGAYRRQKEGDKAQAPSTKPQETAG